MENNLWRFASDSLGFYFNDNSSIAHNHLASDEIHLSIASTDVLWENIVLCLNNFLWNKASKNVKLSDQADSIWHIGKNNTRCPKTDPYDTAEHLRKVQVGLSPSIKVWLACFMKAL